MIKQVIIYEPGARKKTGFLKSILVMGGNCVASRELIWQLFLRDFFAAHKKSFFGIGWIVLSPIIGIISWVFMNAAGILKPGDVGIPYPAFVLLSVTMWGLFMGFYQSAAGTLATGQGFIMQVRYPHEVLLVKQMLEQLANFLITFIITLTVLLLFHVVPSWKVVFLPILVLPMFFLGSGIGLVVSFVNVVAGELRRAVDLILANLIFLTPIIYATGSSNPVLVNIVKYNPLTYLVGSVRDVIIYGQLTNFPAYLIYGLLAFVIFIFSLRIFYLSEEKVVEKMI